MNSKKYILGHDVSVEDVGDLSVARRRNSGCSAWDDSVRGGKTPSCAAKQPGDAQWPPSGRFSAGKISSFFKTPLYSQGRPVANINNMAAGGPGAAVGCSPSAPKQRAKSASLSETYSNI